MSDPVPVTQTRFSSGPAIAARLSAGAGPAVEATPSQIQTLIDSLTSTQIAAAYQPLDADLTAIAALLTTSFGRSLLTQSNAPTLLATIGAGTIGGSTGSVNRAIIVASGTGGSTVEASLITTDGTGLITVPSGKGLASAGHMTFSTPTHFSQTLTVLGAGSLNFQTATIDCISTTHFRFANGASTALPKDAGVARASAGVVKITDGSTGDGSLSVDRVFHKAYTVATLPLAASNDRATTTVTDSTVAAAGNYGAVVAGGGANKVRVYCNGTNWIIA